MRLVLFDLFDENGCLDFRLLDGGSEQKFGERIKDRSDKKTSLNQDSSSDQEISVFGDAAHECR